jgi:hypothetical protein
MLHMHKLFALLLVVPGGIHAANSLPEIQRPPTAAQGIGQVHTLRTIPEACARLEGQFTGDAARPYRFAAVRTSERCAPRARLVDAAQAKPSIAGGWRFNDLIRVPSAACAGQQAVVRIWRKQADNTPPRLDAQGRSRIYLKDGLDAAKAGDLRALPMFAVAMQVEGKGCSAR